MRASVEQLTSAARPITGAADDYDALFELIGDRRFVLIGEASHGTHEFYRERARITRRLIDELGFTAVAVEADWPDAYRVNRYVMGLSDDADADTALSDFRRFPAWMWRNRDVLQFVEWMRARNDAHATPATKVRFYGLDLYSLPRVDRGGDRLSRPDRSGRGAPRPRPLLVLRPHRRRGPGLRLRPGVPGRDPVRERGRCATGGVAQSVRCVPAA